MCVLRCKTTVDLTHKSMGRYAEALPLLEPVVTAYVQELEADHITR